MQKLIYLASPYSATYKPLIEARVERVQNATARLIEQGHLIFSPIVHTHPIADQVSFSPVNTDKEMSGWMKYDFAMIDKCDELWILMLPGWENSLGVKAEIQHAFDTNKTIRYIDYPSLEDRGHVLQVQTNSNPDKFIEHRSGCGRSATWDTPSTGKAKEKLNDTYRTDAAWKAFAAKQKQYTSKEANDLLDKIFGDKPSGDKNPRGFAVGDRHPTISSYILERIYDSGSLLYTRAGSVRIGKTIPEFKPEQTTSLPDDADARNGYPMAEGLLYYFPNALAEVSKISRIGNEQHNPGEPMHWSRGKSTDHANKIIRHLIDAGKDTEASIAHAANMSWRALALLQEKIEAVRNVPLPKNAYETK